MNEVLTTHHEHDLAVKKSVTEVVLLGFAIWVYDVRSGVHERSSQSEVSLR